MNKCIVTTSIYKPSEALRRFSTMRGWQLVIVLDKKSPADRLPGVQYLTCADQDKLDPKLSKLIGWDCIQRRNFGFIWAWKNGAEVIATVDDDNVPMEHWGEVVPSKEPSRVIEFQESLPVFDPLFQTNHSCLWHRGFPLQLVGQRGRGLNSSELKDILFDIRADLWNGEADVDAVCRMTEASSRCRFEDDASSSFPFTSNKPSPFNSQNTFLTRRVLPHYFMFPSVGRYDDIMGAYHVQAQGFRVVYGAPSVVQKRNEHDVMKDFADEVWGQMNCLRIASAVQTDKRAVLAVVPERSRLAFEQYQRSFE